MILTNPPFGGTEDGIEQNFPRRPAPAKPPTCSLQLIIEVLKGWSRRRGLLPDGTLFAWLWVKTKINNCSSCWKCNLHTANFAATPTACRPLFRHQRPISSSLPRGQPTRMSVRSVSTSSWPV